MRRPMMGFVSRRRTSTLPICACSVLMSGCGFLFTQAPPQEHRAMGQFSCTESNAGPIIDAVWAGLNVLGALVVSSDPESSYNGDQAIAVGLSWGAVSGASAVVGLGKTKRCRAAKVEFGLRNQGQGTSSVVVGADALVQAVVVSPATDSVHVGGQVQLIASAHASNGGVIPNREFVWTSSNDAIASVSRAGLVSAHSAGAVVVAANSGGIVGTGRVVVMP